MTSTEIEPYYKRQAKELLSLLYNKNLLHPEITIETLDAIQELVAYMYQSNAHMNIKCSQLTAKYKGE